VNRQADSRCAVCGEDVGRVSIEVAYRPVCLVCAWHVVEGLREVYKAPEISTLERIRWREQNGREGFVRKTASEPKITPGWVYYIRMGDTIKIGYSVDVAQRMRSYPPNAELLAAHPGTELVERQIHKRFREHLVQGREWFAPADEIMAHIESVVEQFGDQSHQAYQFTRPKTQEERVAAMFAKPYSSADLATGTHYGR
jgi:hypothetical protein